MKDHDRPAGRNGWSRALLLALLREEEPAAEALIDTGGDWEAFLDLVNRHGIGPYVASLWRGHPLAGRFPAGVSARLEEARKKTAFGNLHLLTSVRPVLERLVSRGIEPIVLKGGALLGRAYPDPGARLLSDIDLMVRRERLDETRRLLESMGLRSLPGTLRAGRRADYQAEGPTAVPVDIHWDLSQRHRYQADIEGVWARSEVFELDGVPVRKLAAADEFVYLGLHYAAHYFGITLKWLVDLRELLRRDPPAAEEVARHATRWRGASGVHFTAVYLRKVYPGLEYAAALDHLLARPLRDLLIRPFLSKDPLLLLKERKRGPARLMAGLLFIDRPADMFRLGWATMAAPGGDGLED